MLRPSHPRVEKGTPNRRETAVRPVPARYVRHSQKCPQLDMSDKNDKKTRNICPAKLDVSDENKRNRKICPAYVSDKNENCRPKICLIRRSRLSRRKTYTNRSSDQL